MKDIKYHIDPYNEEIDGTICSSLRKIWRVADGIGCTEIKETAAVAFDQANRMSFSLKKYRKRFLLLPVDTQRELDKIC